MADSKQISKNKIAIFLIILLIALVVVCVVMVSSAKIAGRSAAFTTIRDFNDGWTLTVGDERPQKIELPYYGSSAPDEVVTIERKIPETLEGKTVFFLSEEKIITIEIDGEEIYSFGKNNEYTFGKSPGSMMVFVNIPENTSGKTILITGVSPYDNYAAYFTPIESGSRDGAVFYFLFSKSLPMVCCLIILLFGFLLAIVSIIRVYEKQDPKGMAVAAAFLIIMAFYQFFETDVIYLYTGNAYMISAIIQLMKLSLPTIVAFYLYASTDTGKKPVLVFIIVNVIGIIFSVVSQLAGFLDLIETTRMSGIMLIVILLIGVAIRIYESVKNKDRVRILRAVAMACLALGAVADMIKMLSVPVGDHAEYYRAGALLFSGMIAYAFCLDVIKARMEASEEAMRQADAANRTKTAFLAHISHEIRTPINSIMGMGTMIIKESRNNHRILGYAYNIQRAGDMLLSIINDILDTSRIEEGKLSIVPHEYDLFVLLNDSYNFMSVRADENVLELRIDVDEDIPAGLFGDEIRIKQILNNLLSNAIKYTDEGSVTLKVTHEMTGEDTLSLRFDVTDTGRGIRKEDIGRLFDRYVRIDEGSTKYVEGAGLGLELTKSLVDMMGGQIGVESEFGKGSTFTVTIPQGIKNPAPIGNFSDRMHDVINDVKNPAFVLKAPEAYILVVDDIALNLRVIEGLLEDTSMHIDSVSSGRAAIRLCKEKKYDLILMDHMMPEMDGIETFKQIIDEESGSLNVDTPIIILTANVLKDMIDEYYEIGFNDYVAKPVKENDLKRALAKHLPIERIRYSSSDTNGPIEYKREEKPKESKEDALSVLGDSEMVDVLVGLDYSMKNPEFYKRMLEEFVRDARGAELSHCFSSKDWDNYRINIHSLKNTSLTIGATSFSESCRVLEAACREGDIEIILNRHDALMEDYSKLMALIAKALGENK